MKNLFLLLVCGLAFFGGQLNAQTFYANFDPSPGNQVYFGGFQRILPTSDNGYVAISGTYEKVIAKFDANMEIVWCYKFDMPGTQTTFGLYDLTISHDDKILVLGFGGSGDAISFVAKMNLDGSVIWKKDVRSHYQSCGFYLNGKQIMNAYDNGFFIVGGTSEGKSMLLRMDENGDAVWAKVYDDVDETRTARFNYGVQDGATTYTFQSSMRSLSLFKIDDSGNILSKIHHDDGRDPTYPKYLAKASNGDFFSLGYTRDTVMNDRRQVLIKTNSSGAMLWAIEINADSTKEMYEPYGLYILPNDELAILGYFSNAVGIGRQTQVSRYDFSGNHLGTNIGWDAGSEYIYGGNLIGGDLFLAGISLYDRNFIAKVDLGGTGMCNSASQVMSEMSITSTFSTPNDQVTVNTMPTSVSDATWDLLPYTYVRTVRCGSTMVANEEEIKESWSASPQPAQGALTLHHPSVQVGSVSLNDLSGRELWRGSLTPNSTETQIPSLNLAAGLYLLKAEGDGLVHTQRILIQ